MASAALAMSSCAQVLYHRSARSHVLLVFPREILVIDLDLGQTVGVIAVDRSAPQILDARPGRLGDAVFILNECGALSMRARRRDGGGRNGGGLYVSRSLSTASFSTASVCPDLDAVPPNGQSYSEMAYEPRAHSDSLRLPKNARVLGMAANPTTDCNFAIVTTDGRVVLVDLLGDAVKSSSPLRTLESFLSSKTPSNSLRLLTTGILSGLPPPPFVVRMCPALTMKNMAEYRPLMAVGAAGGNIQGGPTEFYTSTLKCS